MKDSRQRRTQLILVRALVFLIVATALAAPARGAVVLVGDRVDAQQVTEVRVDVPPGCVITGVGFRAHQDNFTTMLCRYHRVSPDGKLVDPQEVRAGAEPDHACEATVMLPDGYVAVGFGARGAPEWDITTLRVWARKLNPDGTLGKVEIFNDGFAPENGCEREVLLGEPDRALTGAGLRFMFNDVIGIYARSSRIAKVSEQTLNGKPGTVAWIADGNSIEVERAAESFGVARVLSTEPAAGESVILDAAARDRGCGAVPDVRVSRLADEIVAGAMRGVRSCAAWVTAGQSCALGSTNELNLRAIQLLAKNPFRPVDDVWDTITVDEYGRAAAPSAKAALMWTESLNGLIFDILGSGVLHRDGKLVTVDAARASLANDAKDPARADIARQLLFPDKQAVELAKIEKDTARWILLQASASAQEAEKADKTPATARLAQGMTDLESAAAFWDAAASVFLLTQTYAIDGAPQTRSAAENALADLKTASAQAAVYGDVDAFIASARAALQAAETGGPLVAAFDDVKKLEADGKADAAARKLSQTLKDRQFAPHLSKRNETIADLATGLTAVWTPGDSIRVLRGGDGEWTLEEAGGRWAFANGESAPCVYFDVTGDKLDPPADCVLSFDYFDEGTGSISVQYDSDYEKDRQYHPAESVHKTDTRTWKSAQVTLTNALFSGSENMLADLRILGGTPLRVRDVKLSVK